MAAVAPPSLHALADLLGVRPLRDMRELLSLQPARVVRLHGCLVQALHTACPTAQCLASRQPA